MFLQARVARSVGNSINSRPWVEAAQLDHLAKLVEAGHGLLHLGELQTNAVGLVHDLKEGKADGALEEQIIDGHHCDY